MKTVQLFVLLSALFHVSAIQIGSLTDLSKDASDSVRFHTLLQLSDAALYNDPITAYSYSKEAYQLADAINDDDLIAIALNRMGGCMWSSGQLDSSLYFHNQSLKLAQQVGNKNLIARIDGNIANIYAAAGSFYEAINYTHKALIAFTALENKNRIFVCLNNIGKYHMDNGALDSADVYLRKAEDALYDDIDFLKPIFYFNLADLEYQRGSYAEAKEILIRCEEKALEYNDERAMIRILQLKSELALINEDAPSALNYALEAFQRAKETKVKDLIQICANTLSSAYEKNNQFQSSLELLNLSLTYKDSLENQRIKNQLKINQYSQTQLAMRMLEDRNAFLESRVIFWIVIIVLLFIISMIVFISFYQARKKNSKISRQNQELHELNNFKNKIFAIVAHDLRAPITHLKGIIELLQYEIDPEHNLNKPLKTAQERVENLDGLLSNLFNLAQQNMNETTLNKSSFILHSIISEIIDSVKNLYAVKKINVINNVDPQTSVYADAGIMTIVIRNLLVNAIKFSYENSTITVGTTSQNDMINVFIQDEGLGMSEKQLGRLFTTNTVHSVGTKGELGSGLGLLLCKDFVERNGGTITAQSKEGQGSVFSFTVPKSRTLT